MSLDVPRSETTDTPIQGYAGSGSPASHGTPLRHHQRKPSTPRHVKETLHAHSEWSNSGDDGAAVHRINQYVIGEEIGRGSFGAVHLAGDNDGREYAVKEFSKSRLRKRAQSNILRRPHGTGRSGAFPPQSLRLSSSSRTDESQLNPLYLIREEIAIMKKLNHPNLVCLLEVLDDPDEDSLYMVLEMCKKGVIMKVGMHEPADPYDPESCRCWFRDLILGIEYLHAQGVAHRDIKPDNLLLNDDDELKIVDFGVSEMFEKSSDLLSAKSAGSPAFLPPELCVGKHGNVSGRAADIWSMGVTLYCLYFGRVPFEQTNILELYRSIREDAVLFEDDIDPNFKDLLHRILEKDPEKRIKMKELRAHPWVTKNGSDPLMSEEDNVTTIVEPPTAEEVDRAITKNIGNLMTVVKAVKQFKKLLFKRRQGSMKGILGSASRMVQPPLQIEQPIASKLKIDMSSPSAVGQGVVDLIAGAGGEMLSRISPNSTEDDKKSDAEMVRSPDAMSPPIPFPKSSLQQQDRPFHFSTFDPKLESKLQRRRTGTPHEGRGQAHDPLTDTIYLGVGAKGNEIQDGESPAVSESPSAEDDNIYEKAYEAEIARIRKEKGRNATIFMTRRVDQVRRQISEQVKDVVKSATISGGEHTMTIESIARRARELAEAKKSHS